MRTSAFDEHYQSATAVARFAETDLIPFSQKDQAQDDATWKQTTCKLLVDALARIHSISIEKKLLSESKKVTMSFLTAKKIREALMEIGGEDQEGHA